MEIKFKISGNQKNMWFWNNQTSISVYKVKSVANSKERILHRNMLLPLGIKFIPEHDSDIDSDQEEEPENEQC